jgi:predicted component of type VI protein secretion system
MPQTFQLVMKAGPNPGKIYPLVKDELVVGRDTSADLTIPDAEVSRKHARLYKQGGGYVLEDSGSTNGTFVNGQKLLGPHALRSGESIMFGENASLVYEVIEVDADATMVAAPHTEEPGVTQIAAPEVMPAYMPPPVSSIPPRPVVEPVFSSQIPAGPEEPFPPLEPAEPTAKKNSRMWLLAGCGCLLLLVCCIAVAAFAFDSLNLYCQPPFDTIFRAFGSCP